MRKILLLIFLCSCSVKNPNSNNVNLNFNKELTFDEFKELLIKYNELSPYPNLK